MQAQVQLARAFEEYSMMDCWNGFMEQCWDICYDRNLTRQELVEGSSPDAKLLKMDNCARKCMARHFEVLQLSTLSRELREKEQMQGLAPGTLSAESHMSSSNSFRASLTTYLRQCIECGDWRACLNALRGCAETGKDYYSIPYDTVLPFLLQHHQWEAVLQLQPKLLPASLARTRHAESGQPSLSAAGGSLSAHSERSTRHRGRGSRSKGISARRALHTDVGAGLSSAWRKGTEATTTTTTTTAAAQEEEGNSISLHVSVPQPDMTGVPSRSTDDQQHRFPSQENGVSCSIVNAGVEGVAAPEASTSTLDTVHSKRLDEAGYLLSVLLRTTLATEAVASGASCRALIDLVHIVCTGEYGEGISAEDALETERNAVDVQTLREALDVVQAWCATPTAFPALFSSSLVSGEEARDGHTAATPTSSTAAPHSVLPVAQEELLDELHIALNLLTAEVRRQERAQRRTRTTAREEKELLQRVERAQRTPHSALVQLLMRWQAFYAVETSEQMAASLLHRESESQRAMDVESGLQHELELLTHHALDRLHDEEDVELAQLVHTLWRMCSPHPSEMASSSAVRVQPPRREREERDDDDHWWPTVRCSRVVTMAACGSLLAALQQRWPSSSPTSVLYTQADTLTGGAMIVSATEVRTLHLARVVLASLQLSALRAACEVDRHNEQQSTVTATKRGSVTQSLSLLSPLRWQREMQPDHVLHLLSESTPYFCQALLTTPLSSSPPHTVCVEGVSAQQRLFTLLCCTQLCHMAPGLTSCAVCPAFPLSSAGSQAHSLIGLLRQIQETVAWRDGGVSGAEWQPWWASSQSAVDACAAALDTLTTLVIRCTAAPAFTEAPTSSCASAERDQHDSVKDLSSSDVDASYAQLALHTLLGQYHHSSSSSSASTAPATVSVRPSSRFAFSVSKEGVPLGTADRASSTTSSPAFVLDVLNAATRLPSLLILSSTTVTEHDVRSVKESGIATGRVRGRRKGRQSATPRTASTASSSQLTRGSCDAHGVIARLVRYTAPVVTRSRHRGSLFHSSEDDASGRGLQFILRVLPTVEVGIAVGHDLISAFVASCEQHGAGHGHERTSDRRVTSGPLLGSSGDALHALRVFLVALAPSTRKDVGVALLRAVHAQVAAKEGGDAASTRVTRRCSSPAAHGLPPLLMAEAVVAGAVQALDVPLSLEMKRKAVTVVLRDAKRLCPTGGEWRAAAALFRENPEAFAAQLYVMVRELATPTRTAGDRHHSTASTVPTVAIGTGQNRNEEQGSSELVNDGVSASSPPRVLADSTSQSAALPAVTATGATASHDVSPAPVQEMLLTMLLSTSTPPTAASKTANDAARRAAVQSTIRRVLSTSVNHPGLLAWPVGGSTGLQSSHPYTSRVRPSEEQRAALQVTAVPFARGRRVRETIALLYGFERDGYQLGGQELAWFGPVFKRGPLFLADYALLQMRLSGDYSTRVALAALSCAVRQQHRLLMEAMTGGGSARRASSHSKRRTPTRAGQKPAASEENVEISQEGVSLSSTSKLLPGMVRHLSTAVEALHAIVRCDRNSASGRRTTRNERVVEWEKASPKAAEGNGDSSLSQQEYSRTETSLRALTMNDATLTWRLMRNAGLDEVHCLKEARTALQRTVELCVATEECTAAVEEYQRFRANFCRAPVSVQDVLLPVLRLVVRWANEGGADVGDSSEADLGVTVEHGTEEERGKEARDVCTRPAAPTDVMDGDEDAEIHTEWPADAAHVPANGTSAKATNPPHVVSEEVDDALAAQWSTRRCVTELVSDALFFSDQLQRCEEAARNAAPPPSPFVAYAEGGQDGDVVDSVSPDASAASPLSEGAEITRRDVPPLPPCESTVEETIEGVLRILFDVVNGSTAYAAAVHEAGDTHAEQTEASYASPNRGGEANNDRYVPVMTCHASYSPTLLPIIPAVLSQCLRTLHSNDATTAEKRSAQQRCLSQLIAAWQAWLLASASTSTAVTEGHDGRGSEAKKKATTPSRAARVLHRKLWSAALRLGLPLSCTPLQLHLLQMLPPAPVPNCGESLHSAVTDSATRTAHNMSAPLAAVGESAVSRTLQLLVVDTEQCRFQSLLLYLTRAVGTTTHRVPSEASASASYGDASFLFSLHEVTSTLPTVLRWVSAQSSQDRVALPSSSSTQTVSSLAMHAAAVELVRRVWRSSTAPGASFSNTQNALPSFLASAAVLESFFLLHSVASLEPCAQPVGTLSRAETGALRHTGYHGYGALAELVQCLHGWWEHTLQREEEENGAQTAAGGAFSDGASHVHGPNERVLASPERRCQLLWLVVRLSLRCGAGLPTNRPVGTRTWSILLRITEQLQRWTLTSQSRSPRGRNRQSNGRLGRPRASSFLNPLKSDTVLPADTEIAVLQLLTMYLHSQDGPSARHTAGVPTATRTDSLREWLRTCTGVDLPAEEDLHLAGLTTAWGGVDDDGGDPASSHGEGSGLAGSLFPEDPIGTIEMDDEDDHSGSGRTAECRARVETVLGGTTLGQLVCSVIPVVALLFPRSTLDERVATMYVLAGVPTPLFLRRKTTALQDTFLNDHQSRLSGADDGMSGTSVKALLQLQQLLYSARDVNRSSSPPSLRHGVRAAAALCCGVLLDDFGASSAMTAEALPSGIVVHADTRRSSLCASVLCGNAAVLCGVQNSLDVLHAVQELAVRLFVATHRQQYALAPLIHPQRWAAAPGAQAASPLSYTRTQPGVASGSEFSNGALEGSTNVSGNGLNESVCVGGVEGGEEEESEAAVLRVLEAVGLGAPHRIDLVLFLIELCPLPAVNVSRLSSAAPRSMTSSTAHTTVEGHVKKTKPPTAVLRWATRVRAALEQCGPWPASAQVELAQSVLSYSGEGARTVHRALDGIALDNDSDSAYADLKSTLLSSSSTPCAAVDPADAAIAELYGKDTQHPHGRSVVTVLGELHEYDKRVVRATVRGMGAAVLKDGIEEDMAPAERCEGCGSLAWASARVQRALALNSFPDSSPNRSRAFPPLDAFTHADGRLLCFWQRWTTVTTTPQSVKDEVASVCVLRPREVRALALCCCEAPEVHASFKARRYDIEEQPLRSVTTVVNPVPTASQRTSDSTDDALETQTVRGGDSVVLSFTGSLFALAPLQIAWQRSHEVSSKDAAPTPSDAAIVHTVLKRARLLEPAQTRKTSSLGTLRAPPRFLRRGGLSAPQFVVSQSALTSTMSVETQCWLLKVACASHTAVLAETVAAMHIHASAANVGPLFALAWQTVLLRLTELENAAIQSGRTTAQQTWQRSRAVYAVFVCRLCRVKHALVPHTDSSVGVGVHRTATSQASPQPALDALLRDCVAYYLTTFVEEDKALSGAEQVGTDTAHRQTKQSERETEGAHSGDGAVESATVAEAQYDQPHSLIARAVTALSEAATNAVPRRPRDTVVGGAAGGPHTSRPQKKETVPEGEKKGDDEKDDALVDLCTEVWSDLRRRYATADKTDDAHRNGDAFEAAECSRLWCMSPWPPAYWERTEKQQWLHSNTPRLATQRCRDEVGRQREGNAPAEARSVDERAQPDGMHSSSLQLRHPLVVVEALDEIMKGTKPHLSFEQPTKKCEEEASPPVFHAGATPHRQRKGRKNATLPPLVQAANAAREFVIHGTCTLQKRGTSPRLSAASSPATASFVNGASQGGTEADERAGAATEAKRPSSASPLEDATHDRPMPRGMGGAVVISALLRILLARRRTFVSPGAALAAADYVAVLRRVMDDLFPGDANDEPPAALRESTAQDEEGGGGRMEEAEAHRDREKALADGGAFAAFLPTEWQVAVPLLVERRALQQRRALTVNHIVSAVGRLQDQMDAVQWLHAARMLVEVPPAATASAKGITCAASTSAGGPLSLTDTQAILVFFLRGLHHAISFITPIGWHAERQGALNAAWTALLDCLAALRAAAELTQTAAAAANNVWSAEIASELTTLFGTHAHVTQIVEWCSTRGTEHSGAGRAVNHRYTARDGADAEHYFTVAGLHDFFLGTWRCGGAAAADVTTSSGKSEQASYAKWQARFDAELTRAWKAPQPPETETTQPSATLDTTAPQLVLVTDMVWSEGNRAASSSHHETGLRDNRQRTMSKERARVLTLLCEGLCGGRGSASSSYARNSQPHVPPPLLQLLLPSPATFLRLLETASVKAREAEQQRRERQEWASWGLQVYLTVSPHVPLSPESVEYALLLVMSALTTSSKPAETGSTTKRSSSSSTAATTTTTTDGAVGEAPSAAVAAVEALAEEALVRVLRYSPGVRLSRTGVATLVCLHDALWRTAVPSSASKATPTATASARRRQRQRRPSRWSDVGQWVLWRAVDALQQCNATDFAAVVTTLHRIDRCHGDVRHAVHEEGEGHSGATTAAPQLSVLASLQERCVHLLAEDSHSSLAYDDSFLNVGRLLDTVAPTPFGMLGPSITDASSWQPRDFDDRVLERISQTYEDGLTRAPWTRAVRLVQLIAARDRAADDTAASLSRKSSAWDGLFADTAERHAAPLSTTRTDAQHRYHRAKVVLRLRVATLLLASASKGTRFSRGPTRALGEEFLVSYSVQLLRSLQLWSPLRASPSGESNEQQAVDGNAVASLTEAEREAVCEAVAMVVHALRTAQHPAADKQTTPLLLLLLLNRLLSQLTTSSVAAQTDKKEAPNAHSPRPHELARLVSSSCNVMQFCVERGDILTTPVPLLIQLLKDYHAAVKLEKSEEEEKERDGVDGQASRSIAREERLHRRVQVVCRFAAALAEHPQLQLSTAIEVARELENTHLAGARRTRRDTTRVSDASEGHDHQSRGTRASAAVAGFALHEQSSPWTTFCDRYLQRLHRHGALEMVLRFGVCSGCSVNATTQTVFSHACSVVAPTALSYVLQLLRNAVELHGEEEGEQFASAELERVLLQQSSVAIVEAHSRQLSEALGNGHAREAARLAARHPALLHGASFTRLCEGMLHRRQHRTLVSFFTFLQSESGTRSQQQQQQHQGEPPSLELDGEDLAAHNGQARMEANRVGLTRIPTDALLCVLQSFVALASAPSGLVLTSDWSGPLRTRNSGLTRSPNAITLILSAMVQVSAVVLRRIPSWHVSLIQTRAAKLQKEAVLSQSRPIPSPDVPFPGKDERTGQNGAASESTSRRSEGGGHGFHATAPHSAASRSTSASLSFSFTNGTNDRAITTRPPRIILSAMAAVDEALLLVHRELGLSPPGLCAGLQPSFSSHATTTPSGLAAEILLASVTWGTAHAASVTGSPIRRHAEEEAEEEMMEERSESAGRVVDASAALLAPLEAAVRQHWLQPLLPLHGADSGAAVPSTSSEVTVVFNERVAVSRLLHIQPVKASGGGLPSLAHVWIALFAKSHATAAVELCDALLAQPSAHPTSELHADAQDTFNVTSTSMATSNSEAEAATEMAGEVFDTVSARCLLRHLRDVLSSYRDGLEDCRVLLRRDGCQPAPARRASQSNRSLASRAPALSAEARRQVCEWRDRRLFQRSPQQAWTAIMGAYLASVTVLGEAVTACRLPHLHRIGELLEQSRSVVFGAAGMLYVLHAKHDDRMSGRLPFSLTDAALTLSAAVMRLQRAQLSALTAASSDEVNGPHPVAASLEGKAEGLSVPQRWESAAALNRVVAEVCTMITRSTDEVAGVALRDMGLPSPLQVSSPAVQGRLAAQLVSLLTATPSLQWVPARGSALARGTPLLLFSSLAAMQEGLLCRQHSELGSSRRESAVWCDSAEVRRALLASWTRSYTLILDTTTLAGHGCSEGGVAEGSTLLRGGVPSLRVVYNDLIPQLWRDGTRVASMVRGRGGEGEGVHDGAPDADGNDLWDVVTPHTDRAVEAATLFVFLNAAALDRQDRCGALRTVVQGFQRDRVLHLSPEALSLIKMTCIDAKGAAWRTVYSDITGYAPTLTPRLATLPADEEAAQQRRLRKTLEVVSGWDRAWGMCAQAREQGVRLTWYHYTRLLHLISTSSVTPPPTRAEAALSNAGARHAVNTTNTDRGAASTAITAVNPRGLSPQTRWSRVERWLFALLRDGLTPTTDALETCLRFLQPMDQERVETEGTAPTHTTTSVTAAPAVIAQCNVLQFGKLLTILPPLTNVAHRGSGAGPRDAASDAVVARDTRARRYALSAVLIEGVVQAGKAITEHWTTSEAHLSASPVSASTPTSSAYCLSDIDVRALLTDFVSWVGRFSRIPPLSASTMETCVELLCRAVVPSGVNASQLLSAPDLLKRAVGCGELTPPSLGLCFDFSDSRAAVQAFRPRSESCQAALQLVAKQHRLHRRVSITTEALVTLFAGVTSRDRTDATACTLREIARDAVCVSPGTRAALAMAVAEQAVWSQLDVHLNHTARLRVPRSSAAFAFSRDANVASADSEAERHYRSAHVRSAVLAVIESTYDSILCGYLPEASETYTSLVLSPLTTTKNKSERRESSIRVSTADTSTNTLYSSGAAGHAALRLLREGNESSGVHRLLTDALRSGLNLSAEPVPLEEEVDDDKEMAKEEDEGNENERSPLDRAGGDRDRPQAHTKERSADRALSVQKDSSVSRAPSSVVDAASRLCTSWHTLCTLLMNTEPEADLHVAFHALVLLQLQRARRRRQQGSGNSHDGASWVYAARWVEAALLSSDGDGMEYDGEGALAALHYERQSISFEGEGRQQPLPPIPASSALQQHLVVDALLLLSLWKGVADEEKDESSLRTLHARTRPVTALREPLSDAAVGEEGGLPHVFTTMTMTAATATQRAVKSSPPPSSSGSRMEQQQQKKRGNKAEKQVEQEKQWTRRLIRDTQMERVGLSEEGDAPCGSLVECIVWDVIQSTVES